MNSEQRDEDTGRWETGDDGSLYVALRLGCACGFCCPAGGGTVSSDAASDQGHDNVVRLRPHIDAELRERIAAGAKRQHDHHGPDPCPVCGGMNPNAKKADA